MKLTQDQVDRIKQKLRDSGLAREDLGTDILDHVCCILESTEEDQRPFGEKLEIVLRDFVPVGGVRRLEAEINYQTNIKLVIMKKTVLIFACSALVFFFASMLMTVIFHGQSWLTKLAFFNQFSVSLFLLPLYWIHQYQLSKVTHGSAVPRLNLLFFIIGFLCSEMLMLGVFFKIMQMPGGTECFLFGAALGMIYAPMLAWRKASELRMLAEA